MNLMLGLLTDIGLVSCRGTLKTFTAFYYVRSVVPDEEVQWFDTLPRTEDIHANTCEDVYTPSLTVPVVAATAAGCHTIRNHLPGMDAWPSLDT